MLVAWDILLSGLILGGIYAVIAMGLTLQYGVARIMNLSYGESLVAASFAAFWLFSTMAVNPLVGLMAIVPSAFLFNWAVYRILLVPLVRRAKNRDMLEVDSILATFGLLFVIQGALYVIFGGQYYSFSYLAIPFDIFGSTVTLNRLLALACAALLGLSTYFALTHTRLGTAVRAVAVNPVSAELSGINVQALAAFAFALGGAMVASSGVLISMFLTFNAAMGVVFTMKALIIIIMGGVGNMLGALVAGLLLGIAETVVARLVDPGLTLVVTFTIFLIVLLVRPMGLFGRRSI